MEIREGPRGLSPEAPQHGESEEGPEQQRRLKSV